MAEVTVTVTVTGNLLNTKVLTLVSRQLSQPVQSPSDMQYRPPGTGGVLRAWYIQSAMQWISECAVCQHLMM